MFAHSTLLSLVASAVAVAAAPSLLLQVSGPTTVQDVHNFTVVTTVTNTGDETLKLLNDPQSLLTKSPTNIFDITNSYGGSPEFIGIKAAYSPSLVIERGSPESFTVLAPGASVQIEHDLSKAYNFTLSGSGQYSVTVKEYSLQYVDPNAEEPVQLQLEAEKTVHTTSLSGVLVRPPQINVGLSPNAFSGCSAVQQSAINNVSPTAQRYIANALDDLQRDTGGTSAQYRLWFGAPDVGRRNTVLSHFTNMNTNNFATYTWICDVSAICDVNTIAFVYPDQFGMVHLCNLFFLLPIAGRDSQPATIVHEASHFTRNGGTLDVAYGVIPCQQLATNSPAQAIVNAANHQYYAADSA
ncbi:Peptidyl-Lys metalloendopeptidase [Grifola frondosa]|uniref:Peptidyl-Lys metalloendopeptidase n=1 Tax=Grifola frondosa TaxID=5627 RepID=A0A1C7MA41_GRIFR|nr:Peptidyl-Lys metalloendopeptidase [Grifola frondosa]